MAYKFQIGSAVLSGSINVADGKISGSGVSDTLAAGIVSEIDAGEIPIAKLAASTISGVSLGGNLNSLSKATNGGVNFTSYNGSAAVSNLAMDISDLAAAGVNVGADSIAIYDADADVTGKETIADLATEMAGDGLAASSGVFAVQVSGAVKIASDKVGLSGSIAGDGLKYNGGVDSIASLELDITEYSALGGTGLHQTQDHFLFSDNGTHKKITFSNLQDAVFADVSGDVAIAAGGAATIQANAVEGSMLNSNVAGDGLTYAGNNIDVEVAQTTITSVKNDSLVVGRSSGNDHIDFGTAGNVKLMTDNAVRLSIQDSMVSSSVALALGGNIQMAGDEIDVAAAGAMGLFASMGANNLTLGASTSTVVIPGNLTVSGTTVEVDAAFVVTSSIQFEGTTPDGNEITLTSADPGGDRTITLPDVSGHVPLLAGAVSNANVTAAEFALLDGDSADSSVTIADGDQMIINDGGTMKQTAMSDLKTYIGSGATTVTEHGDANRTLVVGVNVATANTSQARTWTLPASAGLSTGDSVKVKVAAVSSGAITIQRAGSQTIDGSLTSIKLESDNAGVELIYVGSDDWRVF